MACQLMEAGGLVAENVRMLTLLDEAGVLYSAPVRPSLER